MLTDNPHHGPGLPIPLEIRPHVGAALAAGAEAVHAGAPKRCSLMASRIALSSSHFQHLGGDMDDVKAVIEQATDAAMGTLPEAPADAPKPEMGTLPEAPAEAPKPAARAQAKTRLKV